MTIAPETLRQGLLEALQLASSAEVQRDYARRVVIADVPAEVFCSWEDLYYPETPAFEEASSRPRWRRIART